MNIVLCSRLPSISPGRILTQWLDSLRSILSPLLLSSFFPQVDHHSRRPSNDSAFLWDDPAAIGMLLTDEEDEALLAREDKVNRVGQLFGAVKIPLLSISAYEVKSWYPYYIHPRFLHSIKCFYFVCHLRISTFIFFDIFMDLLSFFCKRILIVIWRWFSSLGQK